MTISPQTIDLMNAFADDIGAHFAKEPNEHVMHVWLDRIIRNEIIDQCCSPITRMRDLIAECNAIDRMLDRIESVRKKIISEQQQTGVTK
jgi:hypothetical protein